MNISYILREGLSGFRRARLSMVVAIFTISFALILLGLFVVIYWNTNKIVQTLRDRVEMEAFLSDAVADSARTAIGEELLALHGVKSVRYISKDEAAEIFKQQFGEDVHGVLDFNPLPASFKIYLQDGYKNADSAAYIHAEVKQLQGVDDVIYRKTLLELLDRRARIFVVVSLAVGIGLGIAALFLVSNTIRLAIHGKRSIITTMKLVGATRMFIRLPFILEGVVQGLIGGILSAGIIYGVLHVLVRMLSEELSEFVSVDPLFYGGIVAAGILLGLVGSFVSVRKFISESVAQAQ